MFKKYGIIGLIIILFVQINFFLKIQPFANWYFPVIWFGYILVIDALVYRLRRNSLISNRFWQFFGMIVLSALFWLIFEIINYTIGNWSYSGLEGIEGSGIGAAFGGDFARRLFETISFATVLPAIFETTELIRSIHLFDHAHLKRRHKITKRFLHMMVAAGVVCLVLPFVFPRLAFPLVWLGFYFLLDPFNYLHRQPSIVGHLKDRRLSVPLSLILAGIICGFLWEFWNYWAIPKWSYDIPYVGFLKIFEMPVLGYLGYFPFALELYAMYFFVRSLFAKKESLLSG